VALGGQALAETLVRGGADREVAIERRTGVGGSGQGTLLNTTDGQQIAMTDVKAIL
jgi:hypothetical protein